MKTEPTILWNPNHSNSYETTNSVSFQKTNTPKPKHHKEQYADQLWYLGYEDKDMLYRRQKLLAPLSVAPRLDVDGYF